MIPIAQIICRNSRAATLRPVILLLLSAIILSANAIYAMDVTVVLGAQSAPYQRYLKTLQGELAGRHDKKFNIRVMDATNMVPGDLEKPGDLVISVGSHAARKINTFHVKASVLYSMLPDYVYRELVGVDIEHCKKFTCGAVYLDQPLVRQVALIKAMLPRIKRIGVLLGEYSVGRQTEMLRAGNLLGVEIKIEKISSIARFTGQYEDLLEHTDAILAVPDPGVFNRSTVKNILLTSYRHRKPLFGFSQAYVNAGAIAAVFSTPEQIARQTARVAIEFAGNRSKGLANPEYSRYFNIAGNRRVARSLGLRALDDKVLRTDMEAILDE